MRPDVTRRARNLRNNPTEAEKVLWSVLKSGQLGAKFRRQHPVQPYIVDFCCLDKKLVIEVDGGQHNVSPEDEKRTQELEEKGYKVIRFWNNDVLENIEGVLEIIMDELKPQTLPPLSPLPQAGGGDDNPWRKDFPILQREMNGKPLAFLDTAASAQKPRAVISAMTDMMEHYYANVHRGLHTLSQESSTAYEAVRGKVAAFINAPEKEIVFTRSTTGAINLVAYSWGHTFLKEGDEIVLTEMEHHANLVPWQMLRERLGVVLKVIPVADDGSLDMDAYRNLLSDKTKLVTVVHISNVLGTKNNAKEINRIAKAFNPKIKVLVDGSQSVVHGPVDVQDIGCDFFVFTGHKLYGPTGTGVLWARYDILEAMPPFEGGGDMVEKVTMEKTTFKAPPGKFEAGTPQIIEVVGLGAAIDYVSAIGAGVIQAHETALLAYGTEQLQKIEGLTLYGTAPEKAGVMSFVTEWGHCSDVGMILNQCGVAVRTGRHCCEPLMARFGIQGTVRASIGLYSNKNDIDALIAGLKKAKDLLE